MANYLGEELEGALESEDGNTRIAVVEAMTLACLEKHIDGMEWPHLSWLD